MNPNDELTMEAKALELLASLHELLSSDTDLQSKKTCTFCITKIHTAIYDDILFEMKVAILEDVEKIVTALQANN